MSPTWESRTAAQIKDVGPLGWLLFVLRLLVLIAIILPGVLITYLLRGVEHLFYKGQWRLTPFVQHIAIRLGLAVIGLRYKRRGVPLKGPGAVVANHASWLDIFSLGGGQPIAFVSKAEVAGWPGIGFLARLVGTVFITRNPRQAADQQAQLEAELMAGRRLLFFPEGTSTDGMRVLPFKSTLFAAFFAMRQDLAIQPVTVIYTAPEGTDEERFYGWWGEMDLGPHMLQVLAQIPQGTVEVIYHEPVRVSDFADRKALAAYAEAQVRSGMPQERQIAFDR